MGRPAIESPELMRPSSPTADLGYRTMRKVALRFLPLLVLCYLVAYMDRSNLGIAALTMNAALGISPAEYGFAAGIFFLGYVVCEIPSNLLLAKYGARKWIARIMFTWGVASCAMSLAVGVNSLNVLRIILGIAEAGFFPGVIFFLSLWFPSSYRARVYAWFLLAIPLASVVGAPLSAALLALDGAFGVAGWQWVFIAEGLPAIILAFVWLAVVVDGPEQASFLQPEERSWLVGMLTGERRDIQSHSPAGVLRGFLDRRVIALAVVNFGLIANAYGIVFFMPQIVSALGFTNLQTGFITALPFLLGAVGIVVTGWNSDRMQERRWHLTIPLTVAACGFLVAGLSDNPALKITGLCAAAMGTFSSYPAFWTFPAAILSGTAAAAGIAAINTIGSLSGFGAPFLMGYIKQQTGSFNFGLIIISAVALVCAAIGSSFSPRRNAQREAERVALNEVGPVERP